MEDCEAKRSSDKSSWNKISPPYSNPSPHGQKAGTPVSKAAPSTFSHRRIHPNQYPKLPSPSHQNIAIPQIHPSLSSSLPYFSRHATPRRSSSRPNSPSFFHSKLRSARHRLCPDLLGKYSRRLQCHDRRWSPTLDESPESLWRLDHRRILHAPLLHPPSKIPR